MREWKQANIFFLFFFLLLFYKRNETHFQSDIDVMYNNIIFRFVYIELTDDNNNNNTKKKKKKRISSTKVTMTRESKPVKQSKVNLHTVFARHNKPNTSFHFHSIRPMLIMTFSNKCLLYWVWLRSIVKSLLTLLIL